MAIIKRERQPESPNDVPLDSTFDALKDFLDRYMQPSFGALPKKEIDLLVYRLMLDVGYLQSASLDFQAVSRELRISPTRAKALYYDAQLRLGSNKLLSTLDDQRGWLRENLPAVLTTVQIHQRQGEQARFEARLLIRDPLVRNELEGYLLNMQQFSDYSFNRNILVLDFPVFSELLKSLVDDDTISRVETEVAGLVKAGTKSLWNEAMQAFVKGAADTAGGQLVEVGFDLLTTGGINTWIKSAKNFISILKHKA